MPVIFSTSFMKKKSKIKWVWFVTFNLGRGLEDTPNTAGREGVSGSTNSQTVRFNLTRRDRVEMASSSITSTDPLSDMNSENDGDRRILLKDVVADFTLST